MQLIRSMIIFIASIWCTSVTMYAQQPPSSTDAAGSSRYLSPGDIRLRYLRLLQLTGDAEALSLTIQPVRLDLNHTGSAGARWAGHYPLLFGNNESSRLTFSLLPVQLHSVVNSDFPEGWNDGVLWAGRGISSQLDFGVNAWLHPITIQFAPTLYYSQNRDFTTVKSTTDGFSPIIYPWYNGRIDMPQRFGDESLSGFDWGQSFIAADAGGFRVSYSTQNLWWGPARHNPIIMSSNAPGFPHLSLRNTVPLKLQGSWNANIIWGKLLESDWFDDVPDNNERFLTGMVFDWQLKFVPGLTLGASRVFYQYVPANGLALKDYLVFFSTLFKKPLATPDNPEGNDETDQMISIFMRWLFPESGLEIYGEWARNDHNWDFRDFLQEPDHSRAYTVGLVKGFQGNRADYYMGLELTQIGRSMTILSRATPTYYQHHIVRQGYTHRGQVIGAGIGPGSESQMIEFTRVGNRGLTEVSLHRVRWDNDTYFSQIAPTQVYHAHDVSYISSIGAVFLRGSYSFQPRLSYTWRLNRNFVMDEDAHNLRLNLTITAFF